MADGFSRRSFIKLAATASVAAAIPGCEPAARKLIPYVVPDENVIPGVPTFYATTCNECPAGCGVVARVREGRVIKLEGNPADPIGQGAICARGQASLQGLYNPDRLAHPYRRADGGALVRLTWEEAFTTLGDHLTAASKAGKDRVAFLGTPPGPTLQKIVLEWLSSAQPQLAPASPSRAIFYEPLDDEPARAAADRLFKRRDLPAYRIDQAEVLISFSADFIETWRSPVELARQYAAFRAPRERRGALTIGRAFYVGPRMSLTASKCDDWIAIAPGAEADIAWSVLHVMVAQRWVSQNSGVDLAAISALAANYDPAAVSARTGVSVEQITKMGEAFGKAEGALAIAGSGDESAHLAAYILNAVTGNLGRTMTFPAAAPPEAGSAPADVAALVRDMRDGKIDVLMIAGGNPIFTMPAEYHAAEALQRVPHVVWCGGVPDETAAMANLLLPTHHALESWRDTAPRAGINGLGQPVMQPVFESRALGDIMITSAKASRDALPWSNTAAAVKAAWFDLNPKSGGLSAEDFWIKARARWRIIRSRKRRHGAEARSRGAQSAAGRRRARACRRQAHDPRLSAYLPLRRPRRRQAVAPGASRTGLADRVGLVGGDSSRDRKGARRRERSVGRGAQRFRRDRSARSRHHSRPSRRRSRFRWGRGIAHTAATRKIAARIRGRCCRPARSAVTASVNATGNSRELVSPLGKSELMGRSMVEAMSIDQLARGEAPEHEPLAPEPYEMYEPYKYPKHMWGMTIDTQRVHRMQRVRRGLLRGEQRAGRRQGRGRSRTDHVVDSHRALFPAPTRPDAHRCST